jgi:hypothetical protein
MGVSGGRPEGLLGRLRGQRDWEKAIRKAERSGDLTEIAALIRSGTYMGFAASPLAKLFNEHRLVRKKRGNWKSIFEPSAHAKYADALAWVRSIVAMKKEWQKVKEAEWAEGMTLGLMNGTGLEDINDPVAYVAHELGLDTEKLQNVMLGKTGFGRGRNRDPGGLGDVNPTRVKMTNYFVLLDSVTRKPKPHGSASK